MDASEYTTMYEVEDRHWWYAGMRAITSALLDEYTDLRQATILDAGCGTGANLLLLNRYGTAHGIDIEPAALALCRQRALPRLEQASVSALPFASASFDLLTSFEVLYHLDVSNDQTALNEFARVLKHGGWLLLRLPAHDWLRGRHDVAVHTRHRYTTAEVRRKVEASGFRVVRLSYANCLLFPLALAKRVTEKLLPRSAGSDVGPPPPGNRVLAALLGLEAVWLRRWSLPWGLTVVCLARKTEDGEHA
jgi:SAM-dependent methyltransferase